jgi:hypothetical protein
MSATFDNDSNATTSSKRASHFKRNAGTAW